VEHNRKALLRFTALGAFIVPLTLMGILPLFAALDYTIPGQLLLSGQVDPTLLDSHIRLLGTAYIIDTVLILGWVLGWIGLTLLIREKNRVLAAVSAVFGLTAAALDFGENALVWAAAETLRSGLTVSGNRYYLWSVIRNLSYVLAFAGAFAAAVGLWEKRILNRIMGIIGTAGTLIAVTGLFIPALSLLSSIWWLFWFACGGILLWKKAGEL
jgi:hypothetical protein